MKRTLAIAALTVGLLGGSVAVAAPSHAAKTPKAWMTKTEYRYIYLGTQYGDTLREVRDWVGGKGTLGYSSSWYEPLYCDRYDASGNYCVHHAGGITHTSRTYYWRTSNRARYGGWVTFDDGHATSKGYYR